MRALSPRFKAFADALLADPEMNATRAYMAAYPKCGQEAARRNASRLLTRADVEAYLNEGRLKRQERTQITQDRIVQELMALALVDPLDLFEPDGSLKRITEMPEAARRSIIGIEVAELFAGQGEEKHAFGILKKIKLSPKQGPLELLGKHVGMWPSKVSVDVGETLERLIVESMKGGAA
jgi:phage terminase small subunit